jgi:hypothetical protein
MGRLRRRGFSELSLGFMAPPMDVLAAVPMQNWERVYSDWHVIDPWRAGAPQWRVALLATSGVAPRPAGAAERRL